MADAPRKRRWPLYLAIALALLAVAGLWVNHQLEPTRLARTVLDALGESQGLEISFKGQPEYALRPEPRLVVPGLVARQPGAAAPLLTAGRAEVSLPWDTILGGDDKVVVTRIELQRPALSLAALADWRASRPPSPVFEVPTLTRGVQVVEGRVSGSDWQVQDLSLDLDHLAPNEPARVEFTGTFVRDTLRVFADGVLAVDKAGESTKFGLLAEGAIGRDQGDLAYRLDAPHCFFHRQGPQVGVNCSESQFTGTSPLPGLRVDLLSYSQGRPDGKTLFGLKGSMPEWPADWPVLPEPSAQDATPTRFDIQYLGAPDLSDPLSARLGRGDTRLDATLVISDMQAWLANEDRSPLPPMLGRFTAPALEIEGFTLENVQADLVAPAPASEE